MTYNTLKKMSQEIADDYKGKSVIEVLAFAYLYIPIVIFLCTWIRPLLSIIPLVLICLFFGSLIKGIYLPKKFCLKNITVDLLFFFITLLLAYHWGRISGLDGHGAQAGDFFKHNAILRSLINQKWPVRFDFGEQGKGTLCYYFAFYLIPAIVGKLISYNAATSTMLLLSAFGITISVGCVYECIKCKRTILFLLIFANIFLFATFIQPLKELYAHFFPTDGDINDIMWISKTVRIQYSSFITSLRWAAPQFVPALTASALLWKNRRNYVFYPFIAMPLILYSTFCFVGIVMVMLLSFLWTFVNNDCKFSKVIDKKTVIQVICLGSCLMLIPVLFIACNALQPKPQDAKMQLALLYYNNKTMLFILFQLSWLLWLIPLKKAISDDEILVAASIVLFILPLFSFGAWNDLCMRTSIPALCILNFTLTEKAFCLCKEKKLPKVLLIEACFLIAALSYFIELKDSIDGYNRKMKENNIGRFYSERKNYTDEFIWTPHCKYQYIVWEPNRLMNLIAAE